MQTISFVLGIFVALLLLAIGLLHGYWAFGGRWASRVVIPEIGGRLAFQPPVAATVAVAFALFTAAALVSGQLGLWGNHFPSWVFRVATWVMGAVFLIRAIGDFRLVGLFKKVCDTRFASWDTRLFTPRCLFMGLVMILLAIQ
jgi:hypothetical protein